MMPGLGVTTYRSFVGTSSHTTVITDRTSRCYIEKKKTIQSSETALWGLLKTYQLFTFPVISSQIMTSIRKKTFLVK